MNYLEFLKRAWERGDKIVWNNPDPVEGSDYRVTRIEFPEDEEELDELDLVDEYVYIEFGGKGFSEVPVGELQVVKLVNTKDLTFNERLELLGIETIRPENGPVKLRYLGKEIIRPHVKNIEKNVLEHFNLEM